MNNNIIQKIKILKLKGIKLFWIRIEIFFLIIKRKYVYV